VIPSKVLRSATVCFSWKEHCFLCGKVAVGKTGKPIKQEVSSVMTLGSRDALLKVISDRKDEWRIEVKCRLQMCTDLPSEEAIYHRACHRAFTHGKQLPTTDALGTTSSLGRPVDPHMLVYHFDDSMADIIMKSEVFKCGGSVTELIPIFMQCYKQFL